MERVGPDTRLQVNLEEPKVLNPQAEVESFTAFARNAEPRLRHALVAAYGPDLGREAAAEAIAYGWEHWDRLRTMDNPIGYLYRVGRTTGTRWLRRPTRLPEPPVQNPPWIEPALPAASSRLSRNQRTAVLLIKGYGLSGDDVCGTYFAEAEESEPLAFVAMSDLKKAKGDWVITVEVTPPS